MFGRKQKPLTPAQKLSLFVQQAAEELQSEREELEVFQVLFRGAAPPFCKEEPRPWGLSSSAATRRCPPGRQRTGRPPQAATRPSPRPSPALPAWRRHSPANSPAGRTSRTATLWQP